MKMHEGVDNRLAMLAALKTFGVPIHCEGLCGQCGLMTYNPCQLVAADQPAAMQFHWRKRGNGAVNDEQTEVRLPSWAVVKTKAFYCLVGRLFATTMLSRREAKGFTAFVIGSYRYYGGRYSMPGYDLGKISEEMIDAAFDSKAVREAAKRVDTEEGEGEWPDVSSSDDAWVSHWRRRSLRGAVKAAPKADIVWRLLLIYAAYITPNIEPDPGD